MRRMIAVVVAVAMSFTALPLFAAARAGRVAQAQGATLSGTATSSTGQPIAKATVQLRDLATGQLVSTTQSAANGAFTFMGLPAGNFAIEIVNDTGQIIGTSASISVAAGATITGVTVSASAAAALAGAGAAGAAAAAGGAGAAAGISTALIVVTAAGAAGVIGLAVALNKTGASPSR